MSNEDYAKVMFELKKRGKNIAWIAKMLNVSTPYVIDLLKGRRNKQERKEQIQYLLKAEGIEWEI